VVDVVVVVVAPGSPFATPHVMMSAGRNSKFWKLYVATDGCSGSAGVSSAIVSTTRASGSSPRRSVQSKLSATSVVFGANASVIERLEAHSVGSSTSLVGPHRNVTVPELFAAATASPGALASEGVTHRYASGSVVARIEPSISVWSGSPASSTRSTVTVA